METKPGFESRPHWWEANALTTAPPLRPVLFKISIKPLPAPSEYLTGT